MNIYQRNQPVVIAGITGLIKAAMIEGDNVQYKVAYFNSASYCEVWLIESEFTISEPIGLVSVGFHKTKQLNGE